MSLFVKRPVEHQSLPGLYNAGVSEATTGGWGLPRWGQPEQCKRDGMGRRSWWAGARVLAVERSGKWRAERLVQVVSKWSALAPPYGSISAMTEGAAKLPLPVASGTFAGKRDGVSDKA